MNLSKHLQLMEEEFNKKFKCIQGDCAGGGHTYPTEEEPEGGQCQFCAEYLFPIKDFLLSQIRTAVDNERKELLDNLDNIRKFSVSIPNYETEQKVVKLDDIKDYLK
jgi:hypothetical protein